MDDKNRSLTSFGAATVANVGRSLSKVADSFDLVLTSPLLRAVQSADIIGNIFVIKDKIKESKNLLVGTPPSLLLNEIKKHKGLERLLLIGHQPHLGNCISFMTGKDPQEVDLKKCDCALVKIENLKKGQGKLAWIKEPSKL